MAQLIKLLDYISRYETNPYHYPTQYIRLKQEQWQKLLDRWEAENKQEAILSVEDKQSLSKRNVYWKLFKRKEENEVIEPSFVRSLPVTKKQLTQYFLNELYPFQMKWATSTLAQMSFIDGAYEQNYRLRDLLQRLPDIYLLMYNPIFNIKNAPVEGEVILISPVGIEVIHLIDKNPAAHIVVRDERTWSIETETISQKFISPMISLKRTEQIIRSILRRYDIDFPIQKLVLSEVNDFLYTTAPYKTKVIGKYEYQDWLEEKRSLYSPLKSTQLKVIEALLKHCQTNSVKRPEWEKNQTQNFEV